MTKKQLTKVLYVITKSNWYGAQKYTHKLATIIPRDHYDVSVAFGGGGVLGDKEPGLLKEKLEEAGIRTIFVPELVRNVFLFHELRTVFALYKLYCREQPDIVHLSSSKAGGEGAFAARLYRLKCIFRSIFLRTKNYKLLPVIIFTSHGLPLDEDRGRVAKALIYLATWATFLLCHRVIVISKDNLQRASRFPFCAKKIHLIYNSIDPNSVVLEKESARKKLRKTDISSDLMWIGTIAELTKNKDLGTLIKAAGIIRREGSSFLLCIIGSGEQKEALKALAEEEGLGDNIFFTGFVPNASQLVKAFDIFALTSIKEGLPYVLLEAGQSGCAVVATKIPGVVDIISDQDTGLLVPVKKPESLAGSLKILLQDSNKRNELGSNLQKKIRSTFSKETMLSETLELYAEQT